MEGEGAGVLNDFNISNLITYSTYPPKGMDRPSLYEFPPPHVFFIPMDHIFALFVGFQSTAEPIGPKYLGPELGFALIK